MKNSIDSLPPVSEMMRAAGLLPKKSLGQNFLFDLNLTGRIARAVPALEHTTVIEVGPGPGGLTRALLVAGAKRVIAIEKDKTTAPILDTIAAASDGRLEIIYGDAMKIENGKLKIENGPLAICANLPYNIGTELLIRWLHMMDSVGAQHVAPGAASPRLCRAAHEPPLQISSMTLMFQREVAERIVARPGDAGYGRLSVLTALVADAKILFNVPRTAFTPMPKVESAVVQIVPRFPSIGGVARSAGEDSTDTDKTLPASHSLGTPPMEGNTLQNIENLTAKLFGQRRKMIRGITPGVDWAAFGLTGTERAEELSPEKFAALAAAGVV